MFVLYYARKFFCFSKQKRVDEESLLQTNWDKKHRKYMFYERYPSVSARCTFIRYFVALATFLNYYRKGVPIPLFVRNLVASKNVSYLNYQQHDAHEWMHALFDVIGEQHLKEFEGKFRVSINFPCGHSNVHMEKFTSLSVPIENSAHGGILSLLSTSKVRSTCDTCKNAARNKTHAYRAIS